jgi:hypothetical protein
MKTLFLITLLAITVICTGQNRFDKTFKKADSAFDEKPIHIYGKLVDLNTMAGRNEYLSAGRATFETAKITIESNGKFTINLDGFKTTDTIWITAGKQKVGIPAYKFLEYFKNEPTIINTWPGRSIIVPNGLIPQ